MKRIFSVILALVLVFTTFTAHASETHDIGAMTVDGYNISITDHGNGVRELSCRDDEGIEHKLLYSEGSEVHEYSTTSGFWFLSKTTLYSLKITKFEEQTLGWELANKETGETTYIEDNEDEVAAQVAITSGALVLVGLSAAAKALLIAALKVTATVVVAGVVWVLAKEAAAKVRKNAPQNKYYEALLTKGDVWMGKPLSQASAILKLRANQNVIAIGDSYALTACRIASPIATASMSQIHSGSTGSYYPHRHPMKNFKEQMKSHCWIF